VLPSPYGNFLDGRVGSIGGFLIGDLSGARDPLALREAFGITAPLPAAGSALGVWRIREQSDAAYLRTDWAAPAATLDAQLGLRVVHTRSRLDGNRSVPDTGGIAPLQVDTVTTDWLPSAALRQRLEGGWQWRAAASRTITRPNFDQLSPSLTLLRNTVDPDLNQGSAGNPDLRPLRAKNLDLALERFGAAGDALSATLFWKFGDGFINTNSQPETYDGVTYRVSRPYNIDSARIRGVELAWQRFFDGLPAAWRGLGMQANYTFVDSSTYDPRLAAEVALPNFSRHSLNLIGLYEHGPATVRLAWNWRSRFFSGVTSSVGLGALPIYTRPYGWLDAALTWRLNDRLSVAFEAGNILGTLRRTDFGSATRPQGAWVNDRQWAIGLRVAL
jgi:TonB-dependent receptor